MNGIFFFQNYLTFAGKNIFGSDFRMKYYWLVIIYKQFLFHVFEENKDISDITILLNYKR